MQKVLLVAAIAMLFNSNQVFSDSETETVKRQLDVFKKQSVQAMSALEVRLVQAGKRAEQADARVQAIETRLLENNKFRSVASGQNSFNPAISLILDGRFANFDNDAESYELPGFALGNEAGLGERGLSIGHSELLISANIDDKFFGKMTLAFAEHEGETETELEEAFIQTLGLGNGFTIKAGRFLSQLAYLNQQHAHAWGFADAPLIYRGLFGDQLIDDGVQITWLAPADIFLQWGAEFLSGSRFPAGGTTNDVGGTTNDVGAWTVFVDTGGDIGIEHSWQLGLSHWQAAKIKDRQSGGHAHGGGEAETPSFSGDSKISALDLVYKWAPGGNSKNQNFTFQFEYFDRKEDGLVTMQGSASPEEMTFYKGHQKGWYAQGAYKFQSQWQAGLRYDRLTSDNLGSDAEVLAEAGLDNEGHTPERYSATLAWLPSEFSRVRLQYNRDKSYEEPNNQVLLQYTMSLGSHGAHQF